MKFEHHEEENQTRNIVEPGEYDFEVIQATDTVSKEKKNEMIRLLLKVYTKEGETTVFDYLVATEKGYWKIKQFCQAVGLLAKYEAKELNSYDCVNKTGRLELGISKDKNNLYSDQNSVKRYIPEDEATPRRKSESGTEDEDGMAAFIASL